MHVGDIASWALPTQNQDDLQRDHQPSRHKNPIFSNHETLNNKNQQDWTLGRITYMKEGVFNSSRV